MKKTIWILTILVLAFTSCKKTDPPTVDFFSEVSGYKVTLTSSATNTDSYLWNFGDGKTSNEMNPVHEYLVSGEYDIKLTVIGEGGETFVTKKVTIAASDSELLSGGPTATNGKTWVMSKVATVGSDGAGQIKSYFPTDVLPFAGNDLESIGIGTEYDNEYTFFSNGTFQINPKNGKVMAGWVYAYDKFKTSIQQTTPYGVFVVNYTPPTNLKWEIKKENFTLNVATDKTETQAIEETIEFKDMQFIKFTTGGFLGVLDYGDKAVIRKISKDKLQVSIFIHSSQVIMTKPSLAFTLTFVPK